VVVVVAIVIAVSTLRIFDDDSDYDNDNEGNRSRNFGSDALAVGEPLSRPEAKICCYDLVPESGARTAAKCSVQRLCPEPLPAVFPDRQVPTSTQGSMTIIK
jgi:hypothetical protein